MEFAFTVLFFFLGVAFVFHGFPDIKFGGTHTNNYYNDCDNEEDDE